MASASFDVGLRSTLGFEGGKVDNRKDPGGRTNYGITQRTYDAWRRGRGFSPRSVYLIDQTEVRAFYHDLWVSLGCDKLAPGVDVIAFDIGVNMGPGRIKPWLAQSGNLGPKDRVKFLDRKRLGFWRSLRIFKTFGRGWIRREDACLKLALSLAK